MKSEILWSVLSTKISNCNKCALIRIKISRIRTTMTWWSSSRAITFPSTIFPNLVVQEISLPMLTAWANDIPYISGYWAYKMKCSDWLIWNRLNVTGASWWCCFENSCWRSNIVIMDYKTLFSDINVANEVLYAEDEEKGLGKLRFIAVNNLWLLFTAFIQYLDWLEGAVREKLVSWSFWTNLCLHCYLFRATVSD